MTAGFRDMAVEIAVTQRHPDSVPHGQGEQQDGDYKLNGSQFITSG